MEGRGDPLTALIFQFILLGGIFFLFYILIIRPQQKERKKHQEFLKGLKKGDKVITSSGIWGTVVEIGEDTITLKVDSNTKITFTKEAIRVYQPQYEKKLREREKDAGSGK